MAQDYYTGSYPDAKQSNTVTIELPPELLDALRQRAEQNDRTVELEARNLIRSAVTPEAVVPCARIIDCVPRVTTVLCGTAAPAGSRPIPGSCGDPASPTAVRVGPESVGL